MVYNFSSKIWLSNYSFSSFYLKKKMSKYITVKYYTENKFAKEPYQTTGHSAWYDVFTGETKTFLPNTVDTNLLELRCAIPTGVYGKLFPRSALLREHIVSIDAGMISADFRGIIQILMLNQDSQKSFTVCTGDRIAQVVFMEKFNANFHKVTDKHLLDQTKRENDGFGSTGVTVIKKAQKNDDEAELTTLESNQVIVASEENLQIIPEKWENEVQISSEEAIMTFNDEAVVHELITIDE